MAASEDESSLVELMRSGTAEAVQQALATYGDINTRAPNSESPIVACAEAGRESLLEMLLTSNADPNASSASGLTALCAAAMHGHLGCVKALLQAGANADEKRGRMQTSALSYAAQEGHRSVCEVLLEAGADPHGRDAFGQSPIDYAERRAEEGRMKAVEFEQWASRVAERAAVIEAEPPPAPSPFPLHLKEDLHRIVKASADTKQLWAPGEWLHQKQAPSEAVLNQRKDRAFSSTGFGVVEPRPGKEPLSFTGEDIATIATAQEISAEMRARVALERSKNNPFMGKDDVPSTKKGISDATLDAANLLRATDKQERFIGAQYPQVPTRVDGVPLYSSEVQQRAVASECAAASLKPVLDATERATLTEILAKGSK